MFDARNCLTHQVAAEVRDHFHVFDAIIPRNVRLAEAPSFGRSIAHFDKYSKGAKAYEYLAQEILERETGGYAIRNV